MEGAVAGLVFLAVLVIFAIIVVAKSVALIPQAEAAVIERLGRYSRTVSGQLTLLVPFIDRVRARVDLRERVVSFPPQPVITEDNLTLNIDTVVYFQVTVPQAAVYEISNYIVGVEQLTTTTLRNVVGGMTLEQTLTSRDQINAQLRGVLDEATGRWGLRVARVELRSIDPPPSIQASMEKQMKADREKRAMILTAEGTREAAIKQAEGQKQAQILAAEGAKQAAILAAEADRQSRILRAQGERAAAYLQAQGQAKAIEKTFAAIKAGRPTPRCWPTSTCRRCRRWPAATRTRCGWCPAISARRCRASPGCWGRRGGRRVPVRAVSGRGPAQARRRRRRRRGRRLVLHPARPDDRPSGGQGRGDSSRTGGKSAGSAAGAAALGAADGHFDLTENLCGAGGVSGRRCGGMRDPLAPIEKLLDDLGVPADVRPVLPVAKAAAAVGLLSATRFPALARLTTAMLTVYFVLALGAHVRARDFSVTAIPAAMFLALFAVMTAKGPDRV
ncbi:hypothetical protein NIIDMKKI_41490 [Mycobacterium kansasii]|uniref:Band 7 domain-containing protein n=2 Tax=Mycobacterium kansasii TaxID=1768 RepID=A0A7G1IFI3_MYCKA|nr:hypothetical protein NIIDMKKI_41490 [Mycobacterium kansasii]